MHVTVFFLFFVVVTTVLALGHVVAIFITVLHVYICGSDNRL